MNHYRIEVYDANRDVWVCAMGDRDLPRGYADGYLDAVSHGSTPRLAHRLVREKDGKVVRELPAVEDVGIGMIAGWPTWDQYVRAAKKALVRASDIAMRSEDTPVDLGGRIRSAALMCADLLDQKVKS